MTQVSGPVGAWRPLKHPKPMWLNGVWTGTSLTWSFARLSHRFVGGFVAAICRIPQLGPLRDAGAGRVVWSGCDVRQAGAGLAKG
jgi:hypothetical protein